MIKRDLLFRAYAFDLKRMSKPFTFIQVCNFCDENDIGTMRSVRLGEDAIMQSLGIKDKNDNFIYEGDICKIKYFDEGIKYGQVVFRVIFSGYYLEGDFGQLSMCSWEPKYIEVVGNIYENPNLLNNETSEN